MPKYMNMGKYVSRKMNLQIFAEDTGAGDDAGDGGDQDEDSDEDETDEGGDDEPKFTQADLDKAVARTIAKERAKAERAARKKQQKEKQGASDTGDSEESDDAKSRKEAEDRASKMEVKIACYEADVAKDAVDDVAALAHAYMEADDSLDLEDAIEKVVKKYPHFKKGAADQDEDEDEKGKSWGQRQRGRGAKRMSGVEEQFYKLNPDLKK